MTNAPPHGSPGAPHLSYSNPTPGMMPRQTSYASVAAGTAGRPHAPRIGYSSASAYPAYPPSSDQPSRIPQPISDHDTQVDGANTIPGSWGRGNNMSSYSSPRYSSQNYGIGGSGPLGFFKPTYLRHSRYMEELETAHKAKLATERDEPPNRSSVPGSLSTSSSSVSLHKMAPSHRGMTYEIIEREPHVEEDIVPPLPSRFAEVDKIGSIEIAADGLELKYVGPSKTGDHEAAATRSDHPMPFQCGIYYYEVNIIAKGKEGMIGIGFSGANASLEKLPGWEPDSWAYHGDDGKSYCCQLQGKSYGPTFTSGDVVGCGVNFTTGCAFFTKNGKFLNDAFKDLRDIKLYPSIGMKRPHAQLSVNFGQKPFVFNIDGMMSEARQSVTNEINNADISNLHLTLNKDELCKALVAQYLSHDGYVETAKAFAEEVRAEVTALRGSPESRLESYLSVEEDRDATNRHQIRKAILEGDIDKALKLTNTFYPQVLPANPQIYFRLRCRRFVELMRQSTEILDASHYKGNKSMNGHPTAISDDGFDPGMDLDEPMRDGDDWDNMDTEEADANMKYDAHIIQMIQYGQELRKEFQHDQSKTVIETFKEIFSMFSYPDPRNSPLGKLLDSSQRDPVAEALNSAILVSLGKSSSTALERLYKQTVALVEIISEDGGPGALINVPNILKSSRSW